MIKNLLFVLIELIEKIQYRNLDKDQNDVSKKIIESYDVSNILIKTDTGYSPLSEFHVTQPYDVWYVELENGMFLECADNHIVFLQNYKQCFVKDLTTDDLIITEKGLSKVIFVKKTKHCLSMCDVTVNDQNHRFYSNEILSHNTVSAAITILWYCIFNNDKNVMIIANKADTTFEILDKIKKIYKLLPFFLKPGVTNWAHKTIVFGDTNCRIMTSGRTKEPAIGFAIDFLYLDEFAHIPASILEPYYRAAYPTVSSIENSKIVITSTPNGQNLFYKILTSAELPDGDVKKNNFKSLRVYWWQVPGRNVTYLKLNVPKLNELDISVEKLRQLIMSQYKLDPKSVKIKINQESLISPYEIHIQNTETLKTEDIRNWVIKYRPGEELIPTFGHSAEMEIKDFRIVDVSRVSNWKEETIKDIGSEEAFNQEYGLQFLSSSNLLLDENTLARMNNQKHDFEWLEIPTLENKTNLQYKELRWIKGRPDLFNLADVKNYHILFSVDLSEGLGQDYSVINIWRLMPKTDEELKDKVIEKMYDLFRLEQIGLYRHNLISVDQLAEFFYLLAFEFFDDNKVKCVLEYNTYGGTLLTKLPHLNQGRNRFSQHIFARYKHRIEDEQPKIGIKVTSQKNLMIKEYQQRMNNDDLRVHDEYTMKEIGTFVKKDSPTGGLKFSAESGHDDIVMTIVSASTFFENNSYRNLVEEYVAKSDQIVKDWIDKKLTNIDRPFGIDYRALLNVRKRLNMNGL